MRAHLVLVSLAVAACTASPPVDVTDAERVRPDAFVPEGTDAGSLPDAGAVDAASGGSPDAPGVGAMCPPAGPFGQREGQIAPDLELPDCDGTMHRLHDLCARDAVWLFELADWCPPCRSFASRDANRIYDRFRAEAPERFEGWVVISENARFEPATSPTCAEIRARYGLHAPVLYDEAGLLQSAFGVPANEIQIVLGAGAEIRFVGQYAADEVEVEIERALTP